MLFRFFVSFLIIIVQLPRNGFAENSLFNKSLKVGLRESPPFIIIEGDNIGGLSVNLWESIAQDLSLSYEYRVYSDLGLLLDAIEGGEIDLCINPLTVTSERLRRFQFSQPYYISSVAFAVHAKESNSLILFLRSFFSKQFISVLLLLFFVIFIFGFLLWLVERRHNTKQFRGGLHGLGDGIWWSAVTMTTVGYGDKAPKTAAGRIISIIWMFTAVIIISGFTGSISAALTFNKLQFSINNFDDLRNVDVGTVRNSSTASLLRNAKIKYRGFENLNEAMDALFKNEIHTVVYDEPLMAYLINKNEHNDIKLVSSAVKSIYFGFSSANIVLLQTINPYLIQKIESKDWQRMLDMYNLHGQ
jgi:polar amino acid transport system substrate-binding protein